VHSGSETWRWKALFEGYKFDLDLVSIGGWGEELRTPKVPRVQTEGLKESNCIAKIFLSVNEDIDLFF
jgi:hypothetical protein